MLCIHRCPPSSSAAPSAKAAANPGGTSSDAWTASWHGSANVRRRRWQPGTRRSRSQRWTWKFSAFRCATETQRFQMYFTSAEMSCGLQLSLFECPVLTLLHFRMRCHAWQVIAIFAHADFFNCFLHRYFGEKEAGVWIAGREL